MANDHPVTSGSAEFEERVTILPETRWFWDPLACLHVSRYLLGRAWVTGTDIVDVACGTGYGSALLARDRSLRVVGIDLSREAIETASVAWPRSNLAFMVGDALNLSVAPASTDTVVSFETIEHVVDPGRFLDQVARILRPEGRLVLSTPDRDYYSPGSASGESHNPFHPSEMTRAELLELVAARFRVIALYGQEAVSSAPAPTAGLMRTVKKAIKYATNPVVGRGRVAEALLPRLRRHLVPRPIDSAGYTYVVVVCESPATPGGDRRLKASRGLAQSSFG